MHPTHIIIIKQGYLLDNLVSNMSISAAASSTTLDALCAQLSHFIAIRQVPNLLFYGPCDQTTHTIAVHLLNVLYETKAQKEQYVMMVNCAHGKGIKFIREELTSFAKSQIDSHGGTAFKSIVLMNAGKLTQDAQSALRRCIEVYNRNTRFIVTIGDKNQLLKPILSRLCEMYVPQLPPGTEGRLCINNVCLGGADSHAVIAQFTRAHQAISRRGAPLRALLERYFPQSSLHPRAQYSTDTLIDAATMLHEQAYTAHDIIHQIARGSFIDRIDEARAVELVLFMENIQRDVRSEWLMFVHALYYIYMDDRREGLLSILDLTPSSEIC